MRPTIHLADWRIGTDLIATRILEGPGVSIEDARFGTVRRYAPIARSGTELHPGLSVANAQDVGVIAPWLDAAPRPLLQIDFRVPVPWVLSEPRPSVFAE